MKSLRMEKRYPFIIAAICGAGSWLCRLEMEANAAQTLAATVSLGAITSGFVGTSLSILTSLNSPIMQRIRATPYIVILKQYLGWSVLAGIVLSVISIAGLFFNFPDEPLFVAAWISTLAFCVCCLYRLCRTMLEVFADRENVPHRG